ncbi:hypothetical protein [Paraburkholderia sp.]|uniref:hypothetical protein n=1 Tax=Paraburkholderia sp. TaxID=1926495 RepID=UPI00239B01A5|nr:hypothetical protein [Paraburkholderia sp.]MDE1182548.1 hypothetical protein [Paraburkholderia sp.]
MQLLIRYAFISVFIVSFFAGCANGVSRDTSRFSGISMAPPNMSATHLGNAPVKVNITLNDAAQVALKDNPKFSAKALQDTIEHALAARNLLAAQDSANPMYLDVELTAIHVRSNASSTFFDFLADNDRIDANVSLAHTRDLPPVNRFQVSASSRGGLIGKPGNSRVESIYQKFSDKTLVEFLR